MNENEQERIVKRLFDMYVDDYWRKEKMIDYPSGPWRTDHEYGMILGCLCTTRLFLGDNHPLVEYMHQQIRRILNVA